MTKSCVPPWEGAQNNGCSPGDDDQSSYLHPHMKKACVESYTVPGAPRGRHTKPSQMTGSMFQNYLHLAGLADFVILLVLSRSGDTRRIHLNDMVLEQMREAGAQWFWKWTSYRIKSLVRRNYIVNLSPVDATGMYRITPRGTEALEAAMAGGKS